MLVACSTPALQLLFLSRAENSHVGRSIVQRQQRMCTEKDYSFLCVNTAPAEDGGTLWIVGQKQMTRRQVTFMGFPSIARI